MDIKANHIAVVTGGGTGMGRALVRQLSAAGAHVSMCDVSEENMAESRALALASAPAGTRITTFKADVSREADMLAFRDHVVAEHGTQHVNLVFNNAGIGGGGAFVTGDREEWERTFGVCWYGVYYGSRAFMPLLVASDEGYLVNTSSVNGFWATLGPAISHTSYAAAKFAVKGFTEALITDLRLNAPHVKCAVVMRVPAGAVASARARDSAMFSSETSHIETCAPAALSWRTSARPMPVPPPVTTAM